VTTGAMENAHTPADLDGCEFRATGIPGRPEMVIPRATSRLQRCHRSRVQSMSGRGESRSRWLLRRSLRRPQPSVPCRSLNALAVSWTPASSVSRSAGLGAYQLKSMGPSAG
jgi:hypothetical protein